ncbi:polysaccharide deacetylase family protein [Patescibacteria group bacterium]|nr:polysaccharide deacetylase family protein [Patescibacteria group bacterium]
MARKNTTGQPLNSNKVWGFLALCGALTTIMLAINFWYNPAKKLPESTVNDYYPAAVFKIPEEVLKERIATQSAQTMRIPIIMYHYIEYVDKTKDPGRFNLATAPAVLGKEVSSLKSANYHFLFAREVPDILAAKQAMPQKPVVLTFDDGYEDFYYNALPILKKYNAKGTIYIIVDFIGRPGYLTLKELEKIRDSGVVEIGAHTLHHAYLKGLNINTAKREIVGSKTKLESLLGIGVPSLAYPYGAFSQDTINITKAAGFTNAVSVIPGVNQSMDNEYYLYRLRPGYLGYANPAKSLDNYK